MKRLLLFLSLCALASADPIKLSPNIAATNNNAPVKLSATKNGDGSFTLNTVGSGTSSIKLFPNIATDANNAPVKLSGTMNGDGTFSLATSGGGGGGGGTWGSITGTLSSQTDLQNALNAKAGLASSNTWTGSNDFSGASVTGLNITSIADGTDPTKKVQFNLSGLTTGTTRTVTFPDSNTTIPIASQILTFTGPSAPRTITLPDANFTAARTDAANTFTGHQTIEGVATTGATGTNLLVFATSPVLTTPNIGAATATTIASTGANTNTQNALATTPVDAFAALNTTTATSGVPDQYSPQSRWLSHIYYSSADHTHEWRSFVKTNHGGSLSEWHLETQVDGGGWIANYTFDSTGVLTTQGLHATAISFTSSTKIQNDSDGAVRMLSSGNALATLGFARAVLPKAASPYAVSVNDSNKVLDNTGAGGEIDFNLPTVATTTVGLTYTFYVDVAQILKIVPDTTATIQMAASTSTNGTGGGYVSSSTIGNSVTLVSLSTTKWVAISYVGIVATNWTVN